MRAGTTSHDRKKTAWLLVAGLAMAGWFGAGGRYRREAAFMDMSAAGSRTDMLRLKAKVAFLTRSGPATYSSKAPSLNQKRQELRSAFRLHRDLRDHLAYRTGRTFSPLG